MHGKRLAKILSSLFEPWRVFIALMLAAGFWLVPSLFQSAPQPALASPRQQDCRVCADWNETCDNNGCKKQGCAVWVWEPCEGGDPVPLSISGSITCTFGSGSWCLGNTWLNLVTTGGDGQLLISGDVDGEAFACPVGNIACSTPMTREGYRTVNYRVDSAAGSSASGATSYQLDATSPQLDGTLSGAGGANGWFVSEVDFSASASDTLTGIAAFEIDVDGGGYQPYAPVTLSDGVHAVSLRAVDGAGNAAETTETVKVDAITPLLDVSVSGAAGENGWYVSQTEVTAAATDSGSGLASLEVSADGGAWSIVHGPLSLSDGIHTLQFRATDNAGNVTTVEQGVKVDTLTPALNVSINGKKGLNGWYTSLMQVLAEANDPSTGSGQAPGSGIASIEASLNGGAWSIVHGPLSLSDGLHTWQFRVKDKAGNQTETPVQSLKVDTIAPFVEMPETISLGERLYYSLQDDGSGLANYRAVIEDDAEKYKKISWVDTLGGNKAESDILWDGRFKDGAKAKPGEYFITLKISDAAGNETMKTVVVSVNLLNSLLAIQSFTPPQIVVTSNEAAGEEETPAQSFGGTASGTVAEKTTASTSGGGRQTALSTLPSNAPNDKPYVHNFKASTITLPPPPALVVIPIIILVVLTFTFAAISYLQMGGKNHPLPNVRLPQTKPLPHAEPPLSGDEPPRDKKPEKVDNKAPNGTRAAAEKYPTLTTILVGIYAIGKVIVGDAFEKFVASKKPPTVTPAPTQTRIPMPSYTPTPTSTRTPTPSRTPTPTPTRTPTPSRTPTPTPTRTPTPTKTPSATKTPAPTKKSASPSNSARRR